jgi:soluble lytic murein transglycosylase-like protein
LLFFSKRHLVVTALLLAAGSGQAGAFSLYEPEGAPTSFLPAQTPLPPPRPAPGAMGQAARPGPQAPAPLVKSAPQTKASLQDKATLQGKASLQGKAALAALDPSPAGLAPADPVAVAPAPKGRDAIRAMIARHASAHGLPIPLADAVVRVESTYNPRASNGVNLGLTQISFATARALGYAGSRDGLFDPETNLRYGLRYLAGAYRLAKGDTCGTILRYQAGHRAVTMTSAARAYCAKVVNYAGLPR